MSIREPGGERHYYATPDLLTPWLFVGGVMVGTFLLALSIHEGSTTSTPREGHSERRKSVTPPEEKPQSPVEGKAPQKEE